MDKSSTKNNSQPRRKVLFLGNGILRAFGNCAMGCGDLEKLIYDVSGVSLPAGIDRQTIPFPMRITAAFASSGDCRERIERAVKSLVRKHVKGTDVTNELYCNQEVVKLRFFKDLIGAGFTDIITTNYSYEIEKVLVGRCPDADSKNHLYEDYIYPKKCGIRERKYKIWKYYRFPGIGTRIWHVHGEYLKPHSIIFDYYDYCSLLAKVKNPKKPTSMEKTEECLSDGNNHQENSNWIQTFVWGDIYILGFSASIEEPLFWWAMARKKHKQPQEGRVYFYEPTFAFKGKNSRKRNQRQKDVLAMMKAFDAEHRSVGMTISKDSQFKEFYKLACKDIIAEVKGLKETGDSSKRSTKRS